MSEPAFNEGIHIEVAVTVDVGHIDDVLLALHAGGFEHGPAMGQATLRRSFRDPADVVRAFEFIDSQRKKDQHVE